MMAKSGLYAKGPLGVKEPDAIEIFATGQVGDVLGRPVDAPVDPRRAAAGLRSGSSSRSPPWSPAVTKPVLSSVGITLTVNARSKHPDLAFEMIKALTGARGKIEYTRNLGLSPNGPISAEAIAYQMQSLKDPLYPEFLKLQPTGTTRVIFTPAGRGGAEPGHAGAHHAGRRRRRPVMESVEAASQKAGERKFKVG